MAFKQGWLTRVYTQNIDGLELHPEILSELSIEPSEYSKSIIRTHGSMRWNSCSLWRQPIAFIKRKYDFNTTENPVDLVLVMGTSLQAVLFVLFQIWRLKLLPEY